LCTLDAPLVHIHLASRASFWRKSVLCGLAILFRRPYVLQVHGGEFSKFYEQECGVFAKWLVRTLLARADLTIALADLWRVALARIAPQARIRVLYNAVPIPASVPRVAGSEPQRVLFSGRLGKRKGTLDLIHAFARIAPRFPGAELVCAGEGDVEEAKRLAAELGIADRVSCPGWLSREGMRTQLARATIYALPSYAEGVPMALLEAMSWGVPVLTCPVGGIPEVVQSDYNGLLVTPGDVDAIERALTKLLSSSATRVRLGHAARMTITEKFSLDGAIAALAAMYREFGVPDRTAKHPQTDASPRVAND
jgi:glycosyltransferase involved in cell wall biosynthesis